MITLRGAGTPASVVASDPRRGGALAIALVVLTVVGFLAGTMMQVASGLARGQTQAVDKKEAFYLAEAGLAEAYAGIRIGKSGNVGRKSEPAAFGGGLFWVEARELGGDLVRLDSRAWLRTGRARLSIVVERGELNVASLGVFSAAGLDLPPGTLIDAYDSRQGTYAEHAGEDYLPAHHEGEAELGDLLPLGSGDAAELHTTKGRVGSNGDVTISGTAELPTIVFADVVAGPQRSVSTTDDVLLLGQTTTALESRYLPPVAAPGIPRGGPVVYGGAAPLTVLPGFLGVESVEILAGSEIVVQGPATVELGTLTVSPGAALTFDTTDGPVELYVTEGLELAEGATVTTTTEDPTQVEVHVVGTPASPVLCAADASFHGVLYAPGANLVVGSAFRLFGALVCDDLDLSGPVQIHFDEALLDAAGSSSDTRMLSWRVVRIGNEMRAGAASDPFVMKGLTRDACPLPAVAHEDQTLEIKYVDVDGNDVKYSGPESAFDWSDVQTVIGVKRDGREVVDEAATTSDERLAEATLTALASDPDVTEGVLVSVMLENSPLPATTLAALTVRIPPLSADATAKILSYQ